MKLLASVLAGAAMVLALGFIVMLLFPPPAFACERMTASYYGAESGNRTANGEPFDGTSLTFAHKTWPFGTRARVTYRGKSVVVRLNDRGPYVAGRQIDLSRAAAEQIGMVRVGVGTVCVDRLS